MILVEVILDGFGDVQETARRHGSGRVREPPVVVAAQIHVKQIHPRRHEIFHIVERHLDRPAVLVFFKVGHIHRVAIGFIQRQRQIDAVHDWIGVPDPAADLPHHIEAERLPIRKMAHFPPIEGGIGQLFEQIPLVPVEIAAVDIGGLGIRNRLPRVADDFFQFTAAQGHTGHLCHIEVGIHRGGDRELKRVDQALRIPHPPKPGSQLDKKFGAVGVNTRCQIPPACENGAAAVDPREIREFVELDDRMIDAEADRDQP